MKVTKLFVQCSRCAKLVYNPVAPTIQSSVSFQDSEAATHYSILQAYRLALNKYMNVGLEVAKLRRSGMLRTSDAPPSSH